MLLYVSTRVEGRMSNETHCTTTLEMLLSNEKFWNNYTVTVIVVFTNSAECSLNKFRIAQICWLIYFLCKIWYWSWYIWQNNFSFKTKTRTKLVLIKIHQLVVIENFRKCDVCFVMSFSWSLQIWLQDHKLPVKILKS